MNWLPTRWWRSLRRKISRQMALAPDERKVLWAAFLLYPPAAVSLKLLGFRATSSWLGALLSRARRRGVVDPDSETIIRLVRLAGEQMPFRPRCLLRSLVASHLLSWWGKEHQLRLGLARSDCRVRAHAWIEVEGVPLGDPEARQFVAFPLETVSTSF